MEGLEISEIGKKDLERTLRIDSEFYSKENLSVLEILKDLNPKPLTNYVKVSDGNHMSISESYSEDGVPYYRGGDIYNFFIEQNSKHLKIPLQVFNTPNMVRSHLQKGDVLVSIVGAIIGNLSLVKKQTDATCSCKLAILRPKSIKSELIAIFFQSKYGQNQLQKFRRGTGQTGLILEDFDQLIVPEFSFLFSNKIEALVNIAYEKLENSLSIYAHAETILLKEIGLNNFELSKEAVNIKRFKDSFGLTKRLDAEFYQKKYEQIIEKIITQKHKPLRHIVDIYKSIEPGSQQYSDESGLPFYRVADYNKFGISKPDKELKLSFVSENKELIKKLKPQKGTILFSKDGSVGTAYLLRKDLDGITSGAILHLQIKNKKEIIPEYLTLTLNSKLVQMQAERDAGGSIILHWRKEEIEQVVVPIIDFKKQEQIADLVEESFKLKVESERLLEVTKKAVEIAIEKSEEAAFKFIKDNN